MEEDWEQLSEQDKVPIPAKKPDVNKWDGEDEEEEVKDSWEDEDEVEEKKDEEKVETPKAKPKKTLQQKIAEKEKQKQDEAERRRLEKEEEDMTPEQKLAETSTSETARGIRLEECHGHIRSDLPRWWNRRNASYH